MASRLLWARQLASEAVAVCTTPGDVALSLLQLKTTATAAHQIEFNAKCNQSVSYCCYKHF
jgi:hypothetical protein